MTHVGRTRRGRPPHSASVYWPEEYLPLKAFARFGASGGQSHAICLRTGFEELQILLTQ